MPRGCRKSSKEKLLDKRGEIREAIQQYKQAILTLEDEEQCIEESLRQLELQEIASLLEQNNLTPSGLKEMIQRYQAETFEEHVLEQGA